MLESVLGTDVLACCLTNPDFAGDIVKSNKRRILNQDFNLLISTSISGQTSCSLVARVAKHTSWRRLWDIALDKGVKGSRTLQRLFKGLSRPKSVFTCTQCASDSEEINEPSCFEHACEQHSDLIGDLTCSSLIDCLIQANSDSILIVACICQTVLPYGVLFFKCAFYFNITLYL